MPFDEELIEDENYQGLLHEFSKQWLTLELGHKASKAASDEFWELSKKFFSKLYRLKIEEMIYKDVPQFTCQRRKLYNQYVPKVSMEFGYEHKETKEITVIHSEKTPVSRFNPQEYTKLYEAATVKVKKISSSL